MKAVVVTGDVESDAVVKSLEAALDGWKGGGEARREVPPRPGKRLSRTRGDPSADLHTSTRRPSVATIVPGRAA